MEGGGILLFVIVSLLPSVVEVVCCEVGMVIRCDVRVLLQVLICRGVWVGCPVGRKWG